MPKFLENILEQEASKKGFTGRRADRYVYGAMNNKGLMKGNKETAKGARVEGKHQRDVKAGRAESQTRYNSQRHPHRNLGSRKHGNYDWSY